MEIYDASTGITQSGGAQLTDPDAIDVGWTLNIPGAQAEPTGQPDTLLPRLDKPDTPAEPKDEQQPVNPPAENEPPATPESAAPEVQQPQAEEHTAPAADADQVDEADDGVPEDSRAARRGSTIAEDHLGEGTIAHVRALNEIAVGRGQKLAQMALQWALRDRRVTSAVIGASSVDQLDTNLDALHGPPLTDEELAAIDRDAVDSGVNLWAGVTPD